MMALAQTPLARTSGAVAPDQESVVATGEGHLLLQEAQLVSKAPCRDTAASSL